MKKNFVASILGILTIVIADEPSETSAVSNLMVAQGFLSGSIKYQNEWLDKLNRITLRKNLAIK